LYSYNLKEIGTIHENVYFLFNLQQILISSK